MIKGNSNSTSWCNRPSIRKQILILLIISVSILIGCLVYWMIKLAMSPKPCSTPGCLLAAAQIATYVDSSTDPCEDFYQFACGNYIHNTYGGVKAAPIAKLQEEVKNQVEDIIKEPVKDDDHYLVKTQKELIGACMNETAVEEESLETFTKMVDELNGWPVLVGLHWNQSSFDWKDIVYKLRRKGYEHMMMLTIGPVVDPRNESQFILRIEQPFVYIRDQNKEHYRNYMTEVAVAMGAERSFAEIEMEKVLDFMERLKIIGKKNEWRMENNSRVNETVEILSTTFTVEEFQQFNNEIDWLDFINNILYPSVNISGDEYVIFPKNEFLDELFALLSKAPKRTQANYIIWSVLESYMLFMPKKLQRIRANYNLVTEGSWCTQDRFKFCDNEVRAMWFSPRPTDILYVRRYLTPQKRDKVLKLFQTIKSEFVSLLKTTSWMDDVTKENAFEKVKELNEIIGATGDYFNDKIFDEYGYTVKEDFETGGFFQMYLNGHKDQADAKYSLIRKSTVTSKLRIAQNLMTFVNAMYFPEENTIFLSAGMLQGIFYGDERPMYLNYGAIGSIMGHELTHGFTTLGIEFDEQDNSTKLWTEETRDAYEEKIKCMVENAEDFELENAEEKINGTQTLDENIADYTGVKVAYAAYKEWVRENGEEPQLPGIDYTPYQLFWISTVNLYCYRLTEDEFPIFLKRDRHALNVFRGTAPLRNHPNFAKDFNCPLGSRMNPIDKCQVF